MAFSAGLGFRIQHAEFIFLQMKHPISRCFHVIEQAYLFNSEMRLQVTLVEKPGKVGGAGPAVNDRPGDAEAGCANTDPRRVTDEAAEYVDERGVLPTGECLLVRGFPHRRSFLFKKSQDRLRSTNVAGEDHPITGCDVSPLYPYGHFQSRISGRSSPYLAPH